LAGCERPPSGGAKLPAVPKTTPAAEAASEIQRYTYEIINTWPHDRSAFTQGLVFHNGSLIESTGLNGRSTLREVEPKTGRVLKRVALPAQFFGEGLTVLGSRAFQLTWQNGKGFIYDAATFRPEGEFSYSGEGWGLTTDGERLLLSDGTDVIRVLDPATFRVVRTIAVTAEGKPVRHLNELEWINGEILANVWQTNDVVRIDPTTGRVRGIINFSGLLAPQDRDANTDVLNGIAYDAAGDRLFVTGKNWPKLYEVRVKAQP
jgi:glutamine cyclotransferase